MPPEPKPIINAKQYAISKIIGQLDTKREFVRVSAASNALKDARAKSWNRVTSARQEYI